MRVFVAGATGAMGRRLVPMLVAGGYEVAAMTRAPRQAAALRAAGAQPVVADALDRGAVVEAVRQARPEVVIHQLTGLASVQNLKNFDREFALTNRLRTESIDYLLEGARAAGAGRFIAQSYGGWTYERSGTALKTEDDPLDPAPPRTSAHHWPRFVTWTRRWRAQPTWRAWRSGTRTSTGREPASPAAATSWSWCASACCRSSARRRGVVLCAHRRRRRGHRGGGPGRAAGVYNIVDDEPLRSPTGCRTGQGRGGQAAAPDAGLARTGRGG